jgi:hypothetical protein
MREALALVLWATISMAAPKRRLGSRRVLQVPHTAGPGRVMSPLLMRSIRRSDSNSETIAIWIDKVDLTTPRLI